MNDIEREQVALIAAANRLDAEGRSHGWFPPPLKSWREADPIGQDEFLGVVDAIVRAYKAGLDRTQDPDAFTAGVTERYREEIRIAPAGVFPPSHTAWADKTA